MPNHQLATLWDCSDTTAAIEIRMPYVRAVEILNQRNPIGRWRSASAPPDVPRLTGTVPAGVTADPARSGVNRITLT